MIGIVFILCSMNFHASEDMIANGTWKEVFGTIVALISGIFVSLYNTMGW
jgi:hypothetical protein